MANLSKITLMGRLGTDLETRYTPQGTLVATFRMAVNIRKGRDQEATNWHSVTAFGKLAETLVTLSERGYLGKGKEVYVEGEFEAREWTGNDGATRTSLDVTVRDFSGFQLIGGRGDDAGSGPQGQTGNDDESVPF